MTPTHSTMTYHDSERRLNVSVLADRLLFHGQPRYGGHLALASVLGPHSAVRGVLAALATWQGLSVSGYPSASFSGGEGGRIITHALTKEVTHGVFLAKEMLAQPDPTDIAILDDTPERVFARLMHAFAVPAIPAWADWLVASLKEKRLLEPLSGFGAKGCLVRAREADLDRLVSEGVRSGALQL